MNEKEYKDFVPYVKELLIDNLNNCEGSSVYGSDLAYKLLDRYNIDGSITYSTYEAKQYLKQWWDECSDYFNYEQDNFGTACNPFENPEAFMVCMCIEGGRSILGKCSIVDEYWNDKIELTQEVIQTITEQINEISDYTELF